jgi:outer membrane cobalamin receptor
VALTRQARPHTMPRVLPIPCALAALLLHASCHADDDVLLRVLVAGSRASQLGIADSANAGTVSQKQLEARTVYRPGELLEATPGLIVSQHSGEGKANQFYLRGFNLDHGTDLRTTIDDMPVNQRSHAHGQGWTDLNFLIPELAARLDYKKGPYSAQDGDFASAGSAAVTYASRLPQDVASVSIGQNGYARTAIAASPEVGKGTLLYAIEVLHNDGPFVHPDDYQKQSGVLRYSEGYANNGFSVTAMAYRGKWNATDQVPQRAVDDGSLGRFDTVDPTDGGNARRYSLSAVWRQSGSDASSKVSAYLIRNQLDLYSNFTYFMDDPVNGDQFSQPDRRVTSGVNASHTWHWHANGLGSDLVVGAQLQNDNAFNGLYATRARQRLSATREDHVVETSLGLFAEHHERWSETLRTVVGLRADTYRFKVASSLAANSGSTSDTLLSPSLGAVFGPWRQTEFYVNLGNGFHSNDARGTLTTVDPRSGEAADKVPGLVRSRGMELGVRSEIIPQLQSSLSLYRLDFDSELTFVGDAGTTEAGRPSRRHGVEFSNYYKVLKWLSVDADVAFARARSRDFAPEGSRIPGAVEGVGQLAFTVDQLGPWSGALRLRYFGPRPLIEDNSVRSHPSVTINGRVAYRIDRTMKIELEGFNLANRRDSTIDYLYASRLQNEASARRDIHFHPLESRSARVTLVKNW